MQTGIIYYRYDIICIVKYVCIYIYMHPGGLAVMISVTCRCNQIQRLRLVNTTSVTSCWRKGPLKVVILLCKPRYWSGFTYICEIMVKSPPRVGLKGIETEECWILSGCVLHALSLYSTIFAGQKPVGVVQRFEIMADGGVTWFFLRSAPRTCICIIGAEAHQPDRV